MSTYLIQLLQELEAHLTLPAGRMPTAEAMLEVIMEENEKTDHLPGVERT